MLKPDHFSIPTSLSLSLFPYFCLLHDHIFILNIEKLNIFINTQLKSYSCSTPAYKQLEKERERERERERKYRILRIT